MGIKALPLHPFQREALDALAASFKDEAVRRLAVVLPTGSGKTFCFAHEALEFLRDNPGQRVVVLVHTDELVAQAHKSILDVAPHLNVGIVQAERNDVTADVIVASVQSLRNPDRRKQIERVGLVICDECHHSTAKSYMDVLTDFGCFGGGARAVGYTATFVRGDGKSLVSVWPEIAYTRTISWMVRRRYLVRPIGRAVEVPNLDLGSVKSTGNDFKEGELGEALAESLAPSLVAEAYREHAAGRRGILFAPTVASAGVFAEALREAGITAEVIHGGMPLGDERNPAPGTRRRVLLDHKAGLFQVLCNCMVLTEGYDDPLVSCVVVARPTQSKGLYVQMVGRGLRVNQDPTVPWELQDCLILDVCGASAMHDLRSVIDLSERKLKVEDGHSGRSLTDLEDEFDAGEGVPLDEDVLYRGPVEVREFDPLGAASSKVWIKSTDGTFFVPSGKSAFTFIMEYPEPGQWSVAWCTKERGERRYECGGDGVPRAECTHHPRHSGREVGMSAHRGLPLEEAMGWAEDLASDMGADLNKSKKASWRRKPVSDSQLRWARSLGIKVAGEADPVSGLFVPSARAGAVSDQIDLVLGSRRIDPIVAAVRSR